MVPNDLNSLSTVPPLNKTDQRDITHLCIETGQRLLQHGAESALVESMTRRLGMALGADRAEVALMANAILVTTHSQQHSYTALKRSDDRGINMHIVTEVQRAVLDVEAKTIDGSEFRRRLDSISQWRYPRWLVALAIGISCACFARLAGADAIACALTFCASTAAMVTRQWLATYHLNPLVTFFIAAFVATSIAGQGVIYRLGHTPKLAMASCVLLLVPGFPMINSVSDMVKGHINAGVARGMMAMLLGGATSGGILLAMTVWNVWGWL